MFVEGQHIGKSFRSGLNRRQRLGICQRLAFDTTSPILSLHHHREFCRHSISRLLELAFSSMSPIPSVNPPKRVKIPGLLDDNIMVLIYTPEHFESNSVSIVNFADDFVTLNRLHGTVVSRSDVEFYWSFGVRGASKHGDPRQEFLLGQVSRPPSAGSIQKALDLTKRYVGEIATIRRVSGQPGWDQKRTSV